MRVLNLQRCSPFTVCRGDAQCVANGKTYDSFLLQGR